MLVCSNLTCVRGGRVLFENLGFTAARGTVTVLTGHNGCGKTTLLRAIVGILPVTFGKVTLGDEVVSTSSSCISDITYVGHKNACTEHMDVIDILKLWAGYKNTQELLHAAICFMGMDRILDTKFKNLSSGWKRRVALTRLLIANTRVWIIDEPFANLDAESTELVRNLMSTRADRGGIVVLASHSVGEWDSVQEVHIPTYISARTKNDEQHSYESA